VEDAGGGIPRLRDALARSLRVWVAGAGLGIPMLALFTYLHGYAVLKRGEAPVWDRRSGLHAVHRAGGRGRLVLAAALAVGLSALWATPELFRGADELDYRAVAREALAAFEGDVRTRAREEGIRITRRQGPKVDEGVEGGFYSFDLTIERPGHYAVLGACDDDCGDLDLGLRREGVEDWFADDTLPDAVPMVAFEASAPQTLALDVSVEHCGTEPCAFAWALVEASESVMYLWGPGEGTCFAVAPDGLLLTAWHVIEGARSIQVAREEGEAVPAEVVAGDPDHDLALLRVDAATPSYLPLAPAEGIRLGRRIFTLGYPARDLLGSEPKFSEGSVASTHGLGDEAGFFQMSVPIQPGSSGGPVVDFEARVLGVVNSTAGIEHFFDETGSLPQGVNWAARSDMAQALVGEPAPPPPPAASREDAIARVRAALCRVEVH
jgi:hypothetical protein